MHLYRSKLSSDPIPYTYFPITYYQSQTNSTNINSVRASPPGLPNALLFPNYGRNFGNILSTRHQLADKLWQIRIRCHIWSGIISNHLYDGSGSKTSNWSSHQKVKNTRVFLDSWTKQITGFEGMVAVNEEIVCLGTVNSNSTNPGNEKQTSFLCLTFCMCPVPAKKDFI